MRARLSGTIAAAFVLLATINVAQADPIFGVTYDVEDHTPNGKHGLWTNDLFVDAADSNEEANQKKFFSIAGAGSVGSLTLLSSYDTGSGTEKAALLNFDAYNEKLDLTATVDLVFTGWQDALADPLQFKGNASLYDATKQDFFTRVAGTISFEGSFQGNEIKPIDDLYIHKAGMFTFQVGWGANDKDDSFGASTWLRNETDPNNKMTLTLDDPNLSDAQDPTLTTSHWDINLTVPLQNGVPTTTPVPEPTSLALVALGLAGLVPMRRRRK